jgi:zinc protease
MPITNKKITLLLCTFLCISTTLHFFSAQANEQPVTNTGQDSSLESWITQAKQSIRKYTLANGMTVLFYPLPITCEVDIKAIVNTGSADEAEGQHGFAHMIEHMIFKGTPTMSEVDLKRIAEKFDAKWNAWTFYDQTTYWFKTDNKNWPLFLGILADSMHNTLFDENHFASEVKAVISELSLQHRSDIPTKIITSILPHHHPYTHSPIGVRENLINATAQDLKNFYQAHYTPDKTVLTVVGNINYEELIRTVEQFFGPIPRPTSQAQQINQFCPESFLPADFVQTSITIHKQVETPETILYWAINGNKHKEATIAQCLSYILNERLKKLRDVHNLVYEVDAGVKFNVFNLSIFGISFAPKPEESSKTLPTLSCDEYCKALIENEILDLIHNGPTKKELAKFKICTRNSTLNAFENIDAISSLLSLYCLNNNEYEAFDRFTYLQNISAADVKMFCKKYLQPHMGNRLSIVPLLEQQKSDWVELQKQIDRYEQELLRKKNRLTKLDDEKLIKQIPQPVELTPIFQQPDLTTTLSNGLTVYIKQRTQTPSVTLRLGFKDIEKLQIYYGLQQQEAIPDLAMSMLNEGSLGTPQHPDDFTKKEHLDFFDTRGISYYFGTDSGLTCLTTDLEIAGQRFVHILTHPTNPQEILRREIYNAIELTKKNRENAQYVASQTLHLHLYGAYPWTYTDEQTIEHLKSISQENLINFHTQWVQPKKMFLTLIGNIEPRTAVTLLESIFGSWQLDNGAAVADPLSLVSIPEIANPQAKHSVVCVPDEQVTLLAGRITMYKGTRDSHALARLQGYLNRKLFEIRERTGLFYFCQSSLKPGSFITKGAAYIQTTISPDNIEKAQAEIKAVLKDLAEHGVDQDYLAQEKYAFTASLAKAWSTNSSLELLYASLIENNQSFTYFDNARTTVQSLTLDEVNTIARTFCNPDEWTFIHAGRINESTAA